MSAGCTNLAEGSGEITDPSLVRLELQRLLSSDQLKNSKRCGTFLNYIVEEALAGRGDQLKERLIGVNVFGREPDYDTSADPVVRSAAVELRKRLAQFYVESGEGGDVRIDLHAGTYRPEFRSLPQNTEIGQSHEQLEEPKHRGRVTRLILATALPFCVALGALLYRFGNGVTSRPGRPDAGLAQGAEIAASSPLPGMAGRFEAIRILAGDLQRNGYIDRFGNRWSSDRYFEGGEPKAGPASFYFPPGDPELFRTMREGIFTYNIPLKPHQTYEMRLYFSEPEYRYHNEAAGDGEAKRIFNVLANGNDLLDHFDIISDAGFASTTIRAFENVQPAQDGKLHLQFVADKSEPLLNAIELLPAAANTIPPIRIHAGRSYYTDHAGNQWGPDNFYIGGELYSVDVPITGTADSDIYKVERFGNFYYAIPVPPGHYSLTLYFAETWFHDPGRRVFDVSCNGVMLLHRFDIFQEAGYAHLIQRTFHGLEPNGQGKLLISFSPIVDHASVRALQVEDESH